MKGILSVTFAVVAGLAWGAGKPLAIVGTDGEETGALAMDVCMPNRVVFKTFAARTWTVRVAWNDYAAVYLGATLPAGFDLKAADLVAWVRGGGTLFAVGPTAAAVAGMDAGAGRIVTSPQAFGRLRASYVQEGTSLGEADAQGVYVRTPEGEAVERLARELEAALRETKGLAFDAPTSEWDVKPLGAPGDIRLPSGFSKKPVFRSPPERAPGLVFRRGATTGVIVASAREAALADELKYHLDRMCGGDVKVVRTAPAEGPAIVLRTLADGPRGRAVVRREGNRLVVEGRGSGLSHAVTYLLEGLGCRYLWPGTTGKVIPRRTEIVIPEVALDDVPQLKMRWIRDYYVHRPVTNSPSFATLALDETVFKSFFYAQRLDRPGNRDFFAWHGVNDESDLDGTYVWNHYFGDYWQKYGRTHPDWFALQANGSRHQDLGNRPERPTLCLSNMGLAEQAAQDHIARFRREPNLRALPVCLPDGGRMSPCMCRACRALDPVNASVSHTTRLHFGPPVSASRQYVALTDRVLTFANRVQEKVRAACPGRRVTNYVYSNYIDAPVKVRPDPDLVLLSVAGEYVADMYRRWATDNLSTWSHFSNQLFWRPNALWGFSVGLPQNFARAIFEDLETFKANGIVGTDFDCMRNTWLTYGVVYYMVAKAHLNPDHLGYDALLDDYCRAAYGPAARTMRAYYDDLEERTSASVARDGNGAEPERRLNYRQAACYRLSKNLDFAKLRGFLDRASAEAKDDAEVLARLRLQYVALDYGVRESRLAIALHDGDRRAAGWRDEYMQFVHDNAYRYAVLMEPLDFASTYSQPLLRGAKPPVRRDQPPKGGAVVMRDIVATPENPRNSEGDFIRLSDGTLVFAWSRFRSTDDPTVHWDRFPSDIAAIRSTDGGRTWSETPEIIVRNDAQNVMSVSFLRLKDGRIALFYLRNFGLGRNEVLVRTSADECRTWSPPRKLPGNDGDLAVVNNARVVRLASGRIVVPVARHAAPNGRLERTADIFCVFSDDEGETWRVGKPTGAYKADGTRVVTQEPGAIELKDGRLMVFARTNAGSQWAGYSTDGGETIGALAPTPLVGPMGPATVRRVASGDLVAVWNDHTGHPELGGRRTPLTVAVSRDEGVTWTDRRVIEDAPTGFYCYTAMTEEGGDWLLAYCVARRRNLDTLRIVRLPARARHPSALHVEPSGE